MTSRVFPGRYVPRQAHRPASEARQARSARLVRPERSVLSILSIWSARSEQCQNEIGLIEKLTRQTLLAQQEFEGDAFANVFPVGFCLADLTTFHWVVVVGDGDVLVADHPVFMIEQSANAIE